MIKLRLLIEFRKYLYDLNKNYSSNCEFDELILCFEKLSKTLSTLLKNYIFPPSNSEVYMDSILYEIGKLYDNYKTRDKLIKLANDLFAPIKINIKINGDDESQVVKCANCPILTNTSPGGVCPSCLYKMAMDPHNYSANRKLKQSTI